MTRYGLAALALLLVACGEDEITGGSTPDAGSGGSGGSSGSGGTGGTGGSAGNGGSSGSAGSGSGGNAGSGGMAGSAGAAQRYLVAGTDFATQSEIASFSLSGMMAGARVTVTEGDAVPYASEGRAFILSRTRDHVLSLKADGSVDHDFDLKPMGATTPSNPVNVVVPGRAATKAYVVFYNQSRVAVLDLATNTKTTDLDLSARVASGDSDGSVDMDNGVYNPSDGRVYVTLAQVDLTTVMAPPYQLSCPSGASELLAIDPQSDSIVDLDAQSNADTWPLSLVNPISAALDATANKLWVMSAGCFADLGSGPERVKYGVESIDLTSGQSNVVLAGQNQDFLSRLVPIGGGEALINLFDSSFGEHWYRWTVGNSMLGAELSGVPSAASYAGNGKLVGVRFPSATGDAGTPDPEVISYDLSSGNATTLFTAPWQGSFTATNGSAIVAP